MAREIDNHAVRQRLPVGARAAAARGQMHAAKGFFAGKRHDAHHIVMMFREKHCLRQTVINGIIRGIHTAFGGAAADIARKTTGAQRIQICLNQRGKHCLLPLLSDAHCAIKDAWLVFYILTAIMMFFYRNKRFLMVKKHHF